jgi:hypothetical protein
MQLLRQAVREFTPAVPLGVDASLLEQIKDVDIPRRGEMPAQSSSRRATDRSLF